MATNVKTIKDLKGAAYNPRQITDKQLAALKRSMSRFGDLSGVVFNTATGVLVSGHQRLKTIGDVPTRIVKTKHTDKHGTVAHGHIEADTPEGTIKIPYREVKWTDKLAEMAANVAANAAGGTFDQARLGKIMAKLETAKFDIELTSLDSWTTAKAIGKFKKSGNGDGDDGKFSDKESTDDFETIDPGAMAFDHECPRCSFRWSDKPAKPNMGKLVASANAAARPLKKASVPAKTSTKAKAKTTAAPPAKKAKRV